MKPSDVKCTLAGDELRKRSRGSVAAANIPAILPVARSSSCVFGCCRATPLLHEHVQGSFSFITHLFVRRGSFVSVTTS